MGRLRIAAAVVVAALVAAALYYHWHHPATKPAPNVPAAKAIEAASASIQRVRLAGTSVTIATAKHPNGTVVLFMHGANETPSYDISTPLQAPVIAALLRAGYGWAEAKTSLQNWGNHKSVTQNLAVAQYLHAHGHRIVLMAASMGGLDALQILPKIHPVAFIGIYPVCNVNSVAALGHLTSFILASGTDREALSPVPIRAPRGLRVLLFASPQDATVPKKQNADVCAREARAAGMRVTEITTSGRHGDPSNWVPSRYLTFLRSS